MKDVGMVLGLIALLVVVPTLIRIGIKAGAEKGAQALSDRAEEKRRRATSGTQPRGFDGDSADDE